MIDLTNKKIGRLLVLERVDNYVTRYGNKKIRWKCICDCQKDKENPKYTYVRYDHLISEETKSCGCLARELSSKRELDDITGQKFGRLTVIKRGENNKNNMVMWYCKCDCGNPNLKLVESANLKSGGTTSCGCYSREKSSEYNRKYNLYDLSGQYGIGYTIKGEKFYFDLEDYEKIKDHYWFKTDYGYIATVTNIDNGIFIHRFILGLPKFNFDIEVDHIKHKKYDNRKSELRIVDKSKNQKNKVLQSNNTSGIAGVNWSKSHEKWCARININKKRVVLGYYSDFKDAVDIRRDAEENYYKEYSYKNSMKLITTNKGEKEMDKINRIKELTNILNNAKNEYYNNSKNIMLDIEYDNLFDELSNLEKEAGIILSSSPTQTVGYEVKSKLEKVKHNHLMLSLDKTKSVDDIVDFLCDKDGIAMLKMDGLTCSTAYAGYLSSAETRGNGEIGEDIFSNAKTITNLPLHISLSDNLIVDGEVIIDYNTFNKINEKLSDDDKYKNPRNLASGSIRQLDSNIAANRNMKFIAWKAISGINSNNHSIRLNELEKLGFEVVPFITIYNIKNKELMAEKIEEVIAKLQATAKELHYPIDGIVFGYDDIAYGESLGMTGHHLKSQIAYKFYDDIVQTKMKYIDWTMGKTGILTPTAVFEPCEIEGSTVERASLHNVSIFKEMCPTVGCTANVYKANCIIPQVQSFEDDGDDEFTIPTECPICGGKVEIHNENGSETLHCINDNCKGKLLGKLTHFVSKNAMDIYGFSEATVEKFITIGWLNNFIDIYYLQDHIQEMGRLDGFGIKSATKLISAIDKSRNTTLDRFVYSLSIPLIGRTASKTISKYFNSDFDKFYESWKNGFDWTKLDDFGANMDTQMQKFVLDNDLMVEKLAGLMTFEKPVVVTDNIKSLESKSFCITGSLIKYSNRDALVKDIEIHGGKVVSGVSKATSYLLTNDTTSGSSKNVKAAQLNIPIITEEQFLEMIK